jgi:isopentenyl diphosphate isomerase/L-lactate dehydrogenase-like FMN-dependent dehydrogenase
MTHIQNLNDIRRAARRRLPTLAFDFIEGGAEDETTLRANRMAFDTVALRPSWLQDVSVREQSIDLFGRRLSTPVLLGPAGMARLAHPAGEIAASRAAATAGTVFVLTSNATTSIERVAAEGQHDPWFQLYLWRDPDRNDELLDRAADAGYTALVVTVDVPVLGKRERDLRNGFTVPLRPRVRAALDVARRPRWVRDVLFGERITFANYQDLGAGGGATELWKYVNDNLHHPGATYDDLDRVRARWRGPLLVKGVLTGEDAARAVAHGADGVIVSNHGGRQVDGVQASLTALPEVVAAVGPDVVVLLDGGIRRGGDVVKAVALGARAVLIGRPYLHGLAWAGERGVDRVLEILHEEIDRTLAFVGRRRIEDVDASCVGPMWPGASPPR